MVVGKCAISDTLPVIDNPFQRAEKIRGCGNEARIGLIVNNALRDVGHYLIARG